MTAFLPLMASPLRYVHMLVWSDAVLSEGQIGRRGNCTFIVDPVQ